VIGVFLLAAVLALVLYVVAPTLLARLLGLAGMALMVLSVAVMLLTWRRTRRVTAWSQTVPVLVGVVTVAIFAATVPTRSGPIVLLASGAFGTLAGGVWALTDRLSMKDGRVLSTGTPWHLVMWAGVLAVNQAVALVGGRGPAVTMVLLFLSMGVIVGRSGVTLARSALFRPATRMP
jgi:hypothetical protein